MICLLSRGWEWEDRKSNIHRNIEINVTHNRHVSLVYLLGTYDYPMRNIGQLRPQKESHTGAILKLALNFLNTIRIWIWTFCVKKPFEYWTICSPLFEVGPQVGRIQTAEKIKTGRPKIKKQTAEWNGQKWPYGWKYLI